MAHLMTDLRHRVVVRRDLSVRHAPRELAQVETDIVVIGIGDALRRILLHLIRAGIDGLHKLPLKSPGTAITLQPPLRCPNSSYRVARWIAAQRAIARSARFLIVDAEVRVISEEIVLVPQRIYDSAGQIPGIRQRQIMEGFVDDLEGTVLSL